MDRVGPRGAPESSSHRLQLDIEVRRRNARDDIEVRRRNARDANPPVEFVPNYPAVVLTIDVDRRAALTDPYHQGNAVLLSVGALPHAFDGDQTVFDLPRSERRHRN